MSCPLCCDTWSPKVVKSQCPFCEYETCQGCIKRYLLSTSSDPKCMNPGCEKPWTIDHLFAMTCKQFIKTDYKKHREQILYDREIAMMSGTQVHVEHKIERDRQWKEICQLEQEMRDLKMKIRQRKQVWSSSAFPKAKAKTEYIGRCSREECRGFVSASNKTCGLCDTKYCNKCFVAAGEDHECSKDDVDTYNLIKQGSKPCPSCAVMIFKISGCSQMFCTECKTVWDWNTYQIHKGDRGVHNPHYFAWRAANSGQQEQEHAHANDMCVQLSYNAIEVAAQRLSKEDKTYMFNLYRAYNHVREYEMVTYSTADHDNLPVFNRNLQLRIRYLMNEINEKQLMTRIQIHEKAINKKREIYQILDAFNMVCSDMLQGFVRSRPMDRARYVKEGKEQIDTLIEFSKDALSNVQKRYDCVVPDLDKIVIGTYQ